MQLSKKELVKALVRGLKLDDNIFNYQAVAEEIEQIREPQFMEFYKTVMGKNSFGNGLRAIIEVSKEFNSKKLDVRSSEIRAIKLIELTREMNNQIFRDSEEKNVCFEELLKIATFPSVSHDDIVVMNAVKPYYSHKLLISNINHYQTSICALKAFIQAIENKEKISIGIENKVFNSLQIKRGV